MMGTKSYQLEKVLQDGWGFSEFRGEQKKVCEAVLAGRDCCVYWATGQGKSLCYQVPGIASKKIVVVVSPLISLMEDQCVRLNNTLPGSHVAAFLGSAQIDPNVEHEALELGLYNFVYITPEKITTDSVLQPLNRLSASGKLLCVAIDEAHCISQWGHEFRPSYRSLRNVRSHLPGVPIITLTATAVHRVREDISSQLNLKNPFVSVSSFDRPNLKIRVTNLTGGVETALEPTITALKKHPQSTIVYCVTVKKVEAIFEFLSQNLDCKVARYHAKLSLGDRRDAHLQFLTGEVKVIVATVAFGMGIDKPDVRRVIHIGPPSGFEAYYQQVGRAGRDGLTSHCEMICKDQEFTKYSDDFYVGKLADDAKRAYLDSVEFLRKYAADKDTCRRLAIMNKLSGGQEVPSFGQSCGTCDNCERSSDPKMSKCTFFLEAKEVRQQLQQEGGNGIMSNLIKKLPRDVNGVKRPEGFWKEFIPMMADANLLTRTKKKSFGQFSRAYDLWGLDLSFARDPNTAKNVLFHKPASVVQYERQKEEKIESLKNGLLKMGADLSIIPDFEIQNGSGPTIAIVQHWQGHLNRSQQPQALRTLLNRIMKWRDEEAIRLFMAPESVLSTPLAIKIAYTLPTSVEMLREIGARTGNMENLRTYYGVLRRSLVGIPNAKWQTKHLRLPLELSRSPP
eukprot:m.65381 g.65381  ORF g.65381 m.65381 type:complete len:678 (+) comp11733_c0_seq1:140-2173(+)